MERVGHHLVFELKGCWTRPYDDPEDEWWCEIVDGKGLVVVVVEQSGFEFSSPLDDFEGPSESLFPLRAKENPEHYCVCDTRHPYDPDSRVSCFAKVWRYFLPGDWRNSRLVGRKLRDAVIDAGSCLCGECCSAVGSTFQ